MAFSLIKDKRLRALRFAMALAISSFVIGIMGYIRFAELSLVEAFYMTVITISTVGFNEVKPLSENAQLFTSIFIIYNLTIFAFIVSVVTRYIFEGELKDIYKNYMTNLDVKKLKDHVIVCGYGRNGSKACEELLNSNTPFVVIDKNDDVVRHQLRGQDKITYLEGEATSEEILNRAGIDRAQAIISTLPNDADNVFVSLTARQINPNINIIARASQMSSESKLLRAGANKVVMPDVIGGLHMAHLITKPDVIDFIDLISGMGDVKLKLDEVLYSEFKDEYKNKTLRDLDIRNKTGATVIGFKDNVEGFIINPSPDQIIGPDDILIILGKEEEVMTFRKMCVAN